MGFINSATNWMPCDILERLTWRDVGDLLRGWRKSPPLQRMFQDWLRLKGFEYRDESPVDDAPGEPSWFDSMNADEFTSELSRQGAELAKKLKLN